MQFPLRDEARLRKWVDNMERKEWSPSRHQYLCSEHFTEDSFDLRWGIRYLKHTAVPTIFPFIYDTGESPNIQVLPPGFVEPASRQPDEEALIDSGLSMPSEAQQFPSSAPSPPSGSSDRLQAASSRTESAPPSAACGEDLQGAPSSVERSLLEEHSYSRQDMDKNQLWNKIASLHMKIMELEKREEGTIAKINSLENTIVHLRKENIVSEEKQKALEGYFTTVFL
ncbi:THAP domain-containing protein 5-like [Scleropages formosus]|uniref:THAP domain-containing protein 5 n=1 Tax=Scleropages formosus TaxID=113540 RepID=A0A0P7Z4U9_SCLFO|nr:THAP domain-containing protein 5-like [Scleropages formosus]